MIHKLLEDLVRPALQSHGGDVEYVSYADGILKLRLLGRCASCPAANLTNETIIEGQLKEHMSDLKEVILVQEVSSDLLAQARAMMGQHKA